MYLLRIPGEDARPDKALRLRASRLYATPEEAWEEVARMHPS